MTSPARCSVWMFRRVHVMRELDGAEFETKHGLFRLRGRAAIIKVQEEAVLSLEHLAPFGGNSQLSRLTCLERALSVGPAAPSRCALSPDHGLPLKSDPLFPSRWGLSFNRGSLRAIFFGRLASSRCPTFLSVRNRRVDGVLKPGDLGSSRFHVNLDLDSYFGDPVVVRLFSALLVSVPASNSILNSLMVRSAIWGAEQTPF
jgi:hypothetical protein